MSEGNNRKMYFFLSMYATIQKIIHLSFIYLLPYKEIHSQYLSCLLLKVDPFELEDIEVLETFLNGRPNGFSQTYPMELPEGRCLVYITESKGN